MFINQKIMKKYLILGFLFVSISGLCYTPEYRYVSDYRVNTGTGEKEKANQREYFTCVFSDDMTMCYVVWFEGELKKDHYSNTSVFNKGEYGYKEKGCYEYRYIKTENGVKIYKKECAYYGEAHAKMSGGFPPKNDFVYSSPKSFIHYIYFSTDYSKMNEPSGSIYVRTYDRIIADEVGKPTQIW